MKSMPFGAAWMDPEIIMPSEVSHKNVYHLYVESKIG